jgi:hypothetical protein
VSLSADELKGLLRVIGLAREDGELYANQREKFLEILEMAKHLAIASQRITKRRSVVLLDCACGKGYLTFTLNCMLTHKLGRPAFFIGVDRNPQLIRKCKKTQHLLGFENMEFYAADIVKSVLDKKADITYCLHACDIATDETITKGIVSSSRFIVVVPCCQREISYGMRAHPLTIMTQFPTVKERLSCLVTDTMRAFILGDAGYKVEMFEFVSSKVTPKNLMLRAERIWPEKADMMEQYWRLRAMFNVEPKIEEYLTWLRPR